MRKISSLFAVSAICAASLSAAAPANRDAAASMPEGAVYIHTARNAPRFVKISRPLTLSSGDTVLAEGLSVECAKNQTAIIVLSNRTAIYVMPGAKLEIEKFEQMTPEAAPSGEEDEPSRSILQLRLDRGEISVSALSARATSKTVVKTPFGIIEPRSRALIISCAADAAKIYILNGRASFTSPDGRNDFIQNGQVGIMAKNRNTHAMFPLQVEDILSVDEDILSASTKVAARAAESALFSFDENGKVSVLKILPGDFFIKRARYDYRR